MIGTVSESSCYVISILGKPKPDIINLIDSWARYIQSAKLESTSIHSNSEGP